eukprot:608416-Amphidinium_carterae.1
MTLVPAGAIWDKLTPTLEKANTSEPSPTQSLLSKEYPWTANMFESIKLGNIGMGGVNRALTVGLTGESAAVEGPLPSFSKNWPSHGKSYQLPFLKR